MANHYYIKAASPIEDLGAALKNISERRFRGFVKVIEDTGDYCRIELPDCGEMQVWQHSPKRLEVRHPWGPMMDWVWAVTVDELAGKGGRVSGEGGDRSWKAEGGKYPTYKSWLEGFILPGTPRVRKALIMCLHKSGVPKAYKSLWN